MKKYVYANLKRFDIPKERAGINSLCASSEWGAVMASKLNKALKDIPDSVEIVVFLPEAHLISALNGGLSAGCQGVYRKDTAPGGNFGAFTTQRTANSMRAIGCSYTIIGHCEERADKAEIMALAGSVSTEAVSAILNEEILRAQDAGMIVLYCVGEKIEERDSWESVISQQLRIGLRNTDTTKLRIAYEPVWAIGPNRPVPAAPDILKVVKLCKSLCPDVPVLYGGGLKQDNAPMLAGIPELDGGLVGLTRFSEDIGFYPDEFADIIQTYIGKS